MTTSHERLVGQPTQATNQPTNDDGVPDPDKPYYEVTLAIDPDSDNIYVGDPCPGSTVIGEGMTNNAGEWTRLDFADGWHPVGLRQALADERESLDEARAEAATYRDACEAMSQVARMAIDIGIKQGEDLHHLMKTHRLLSYTLLTLLSGSEEEVEAAFNQAVPMFLEPPCEVCDISIPGEDEDLYREWRHAMADGVQRLINLHTPTNDKDNHDQ